MSRLPLQSICLAWEKQNSKYLLLFSFTDVLVFLLFSCPESKCMFLALNQTSKYESKYSFFKKFTSTSKNFKNVTGSIVEKHQLLQA